MGRLLLDQYSMQRGGTYIMSFSTTRHAQRCRLKNKWRYVSFRIAVRNWAVGGGKPRVKRLCMKPIVIKRRTFFHFSRTIISNIYCWFIIFILYKSGLWSLSPCFWSNRCKSWWKNRSIWTATISQKQSNRFRFW